jgi:hypothetical protein
MEYLTIEDIQKLTKKSQPTVRRWLRDFKKEKPQAIKRENIKGKVKVMVLRQEVIKAFGLEGEEEEEKRKQQETVPEPYKTIIDALTNQLNEKDKQIERLLHTNTQQSAFIAGMQGTKTLTDGKKKGFFQKIFGSSEEE